MSPLWAMPALWKTGLLLSFFSYSICLEEECVFAIFGHPVTLPCFYNGPNLDSTNFSIEWRRNDIVVFRAAWQDKSNTNYSIVSSDAPQTRNFSLWLSTVNPEELQTNYSLHLIFSGKEQSPPLCKVCVRTAASFSMPWLQREDPGGGNETVFMCQSSGGFPKPAVHWLIDDTEEPPEGAVRTLAAPLPGSPMYNITSHLIANISQHRNVKCIIENMSMNETLTITSYGVHSNTVAGRAAEAMWVFSTALCVAVGLMVFAALVYQIFLDRNHKKHHHSDKGYKDQYEDTGETAVQSSEEVLCFTETTV